MKSLKEYMVFEQAMSVLKSIRKRLGLFFWMVVLDVLGLLFFGFFGSTIGVRIQNQFSLLFKMMAPAEIGLDFLFNAQAEYLEPGQALFFSERTKLFMYILLFIIMTYVIYCIFDGIGWVLAKRMNKEKVGFWEYMAHFAYVNVVWFFLLTVIFVFAVKLSYLKAFVVSPALIQLMVMIFAGIFSAFVLYIGFISYSLVGKKVCWKEIFSVPFRSGKYIWMYVFLIVAYVVMNYVVQLLGLIHEIVWVVSGVLLMVPLFAYSRLYIDSFVKNIEKK